MSGTLLSPEELAAHASTCEVTFAIWSGSDELVIDAQNEKAVESLAKYLNLPVSSLGDEQSQALKASLPTAIEFGLNINPFAGQEGPSSATAHGERKMLLDVRLVLRKLSDTHDKAAAARPQVSLRQADWLSRSEHNKLVQMAKLGRHEESEASDDMEDGATQIMVAVEALSEGAVDLIAARGKEEAANASNSASTSNLTASTKSSRCVLRTWHHLPSLSTKEKRDDLVSYAQSRGFTGFVLAGKPGLVVVECPLAALSEDGTSDQSNSASTASSPHRKANLLAGTREIDSYWSTIKSESWADIPAFQKKVSETLREEYVDRVFEDMREITNSEDTGKGWRNDMSKVEAWLRGKGVGGRLREALAADW